MLYTEYFLDLSAGSNGSGLSQGSPWNTVANAISGLTTIFGGTTATGLSRVNVTGTRAMTTTAVAFSVAGTAAFPLVWRGYAVTPGDLDDDPATAGPSLTFTTVGVTVSASNQVFQNLDFTSAIASGNGTLIASAASPVQFDRCRIENTSASYGRGASLGVACGTGGTGVAGGSVC